MHVLLFNLRLDADDDVLGFTTEWVNAIADRVDAVTVITMHLGRVAVRPNVRVLSVGRERGLSEPRRVLEFYRLLGRTLRRGRPDVCFAHMIPVFAVLFAPVAKLWRIPIVLWYGHGSVPPMLRLAHLLVDREVTSAPSGFRLPSRKLKVLQQGIDPKRFAAPADPGPEWARSVVMVGRISAVKGVLKAVDAVAAARRDGAALRLVVTGGPLTDADLAYEKRVRERIREHGIEAHVELRGAVPFHEVAAAYRLGGVYLSSSGTGSLDKTILEAMLSGCLPVCTNVSYAQIAREEGFGWLVPQDEDPATLAAVLRRAAELPAQEAADLRVRVREAAASRHGLDRLADRVVAELRDVRRR